MVSAATRATPARGEKFFMATACANQRASRLRAVAFVVRFRPGQQAESRMAVAELSRSLEDAVGSPSLNLRFPGLIL
jgi:hypothetical protein